MKKDDPKHQRGAWLWPGMVIVLLAGQVVIGAVTVSLALSDPSVAIEPEYYRKASNWDTRNAEQIQQAGMSAAFDIGPPAAAIQERTVLFSLRDGRGAPVDDARVSIEAFHHAHGNERAQRKLQRIGAGVYAGSFPMRHSGLWELRASIEQGDRRFSHTEVIDLEATE